MKIILRKNPRLEITFENSSFSVQNIQYKDENNQYDYAHIESAILNKEHTNWIVTILSYIVGGGSTYKNKQNLLLIYKGLSKTITLNNCDHKQVDQLIKELKLRIIA